ncbi:MAG: GNAT family N-acetyltransferase [Rubrivivax sp.]|jgi:GNAT superfamily N-acetyltransferase|nr:GNAT family N-acetyltransferase [Rubrivivax sp.]
MRIELAPHPDDALRAAIQAPLKAFNDSLSGPSGFQTLAVALRNAEGEVVGGLWGHTAYGWLYTQLLAVPADARQQGLGRDLMRCAETEARARGCHAAWVDTIFGARGFYERLGYRVFGELPDHPAGWTRSFLHKTLA